MANPLRVSTRNATFQRWQTLLTNRNKRLRANEFLVQGVRPITLAIEQGWKVRELLHDGRPSPSPWAADLRRRIQTTQYLLSPDLMQELGEKSDGTPELLAVVEMQADELDRIPVSADMLIAVFDRPSSPGNLGNLIRSVDAFGGSAVVVTGHAADPYDPKCIRASTGSFFSVPVVRTPSHREILEWVGQLRSKGVSIVVVGTDESGSTDIADFDLTQPVLIVVGNETVGMTTAWRDSCDYVVRIPMGGTASSLNAANAGSVVFYEAMRQRIAAGVNQAR